MLIIFKIKNYFKYHDSKKYINLYFFSNLYFNIFDCSEEQNFEVHNLNLKFNSV